MKFQTNHDDYPKCPGQSIKILYARKTKDVICYSFRDREYGWCGTCNLKAKEGERGHCPNEYGTYIHEEVPENNKEENTKVHVAENWGFCSSSCTVDDHFTKVLQETKITVLTDNECKVFEKDSDLEDYETEDSDQLYIPGMLKFNSVFS